MASKVKLQQKVEFSEKNKLASLCNNYNKVCDERIMP
jgi:hypothetical protein